MTPPQASTLPAAGVTETTPRTRAKLGSLRALWPFVRRHMGLFVSWLVALVLASAAILSLPYAFKQMIDHGFSKASGALCLAHGVTMLLSSDRDVSAFPALQVRNPLRPDAE